jgi:hypothetical protein
MSIEKANQQEAAQPQQPHFNDMLWGATSQLLPNDAPVESMLLPNVSDTSDVNVALTIDALKGPVWSLSQHLP